MKRKPELLFISTRFLFPADTGGQIRTSQILRGMKGGEFNIVLASPAPPDALQRFRLEIESVANRFVSWPEQTRSRLSALLRMRHIFRKIPIPVITDWSAEAQHVVDEELARRYDLVVVDFPHAAILIPESINLPSVMFTHNVESEIFLRHVRVSREPLSRYIWNNQYLKMFEFERTVLSRFNRVIAVSERDRDMFDEYYSISNVDVIPTGVDLNYFSFSPPAATSDIVFTGSMDWLANIDGIRYFLEEVWPQVSQTLPRAKMTVVGRNPPERLVEQAAGLNWEFTGFVDDVRPYVRKSSVFVIPLRVAGGTRLKVFEAMASGCPVVSTSIGVEGLPLKDGEHYLRADSSGEIAAAVLRLLSDDVLRGQLAMNARKYVEENFSFTRAAREFENICMNTLGFSQVNGPDQE